MPVYIPANNQSIVAIPDVWEEVVKRMDDDVKRRRQEELVSAMGVQPQQPEKKKQSQQEEEDNSSLDNEILKQLMNRGSTGKPMTIDGMQGMSGADFPASSVAMSEVGATGLPEGMSMVNGAATTGAVGGDAGSGILASMMGGSDTGALGSAAAVAAPVAGIVGALYGLDQWLNEGRGTDEWKRFGNKLGKMIGIKAFK